MAECIILAGGKSTRMGTNKLLLNYQGRPLIWHTIYSVLPYVSRVIVVTGKYHQEIQEALKGEQIEIVYNNNYEQGMFSSVLMGIKKTTDDFLIIPGDCPFVKEETIKKILHGSGDIRYPKCGELEGHPIYISKKYKEELLKLDLDYNLKLFRNSKKCEIINVDDKNIAINLNSKLDFNNLLKNKETA